MGLADNFSIQLFSGGVCDFADPSAHEFAIEDVAHGLSQMCRFNGQIKRFYSVAQHAYNASLIVEPGHEYDALMHDASEAFAADIVSPLKKMLPDYLVIEAKIMMALSEQFGFSPRLNDAVKLADIKMLKVEKDLFHGGPEWDMLRDVVVTDMEYNRLLLRYMPPPNEDGFCEMKSLFLERFEQVSR